jgi:hypothetical protein
MIPISFVFGYLGKSLIYATLKAQRFSWASERQTSRAEDLAYCLLGLFDVHMPLLYGEGSQKAFVRLQEEIMRVNDDQSIFAWGLKYFPDLGWDCSSPEELMLLPDQDGKLEFGAVPLLAASPASFKNSGDIVPCKRSPMNRGQPHSMTNRGLRIDTHFLQNRIELLNLPFFHPSTFDPPESRRWYVALGCVQEKEPYRPLTMCVLHLEENIYARALNIYPIAAAVAPATYTENPLQSIYLLRQPQPYISSSLSTDMLNNTILLRELPRHFGACESSFPPGVWDSTNMAVSIPPGVWSAVLVFSLISTDFKVALVLKCQRPVWYCRLDRVGFRDTAKQVASRWNDYNRQELLEASRVSTQAAEFTLVGYIHHVWTSEDLVLGGITCLHIDTLPLSESSSMLSHLRLN